MPHELILIIEDHDKNRKLVREILQVTGYRTLEAETAEEGIRLAREARPALVEFLVKSVAGGVSAWGALGSRAWAAPMGANGDIRVAVIGVRGQGNYHIRLYGKVPGVRLVALCDIDETVLDRRVAELAAQGLQVAKYTDVRKLLENKDIDAVSIATPNHWHSLMAVWACEAGKDVYCEKPISHNVWEGRKVVEAAARHNRIVQAGTQSRSDEALIQLRAYLRSGQLGEIGIFAYRESLIEHANLV